MEKLPPQPPPRGQVASQRDFRDAGPHSALQLVSQLTVFRNLPFNEHSTGGSFVESALPASDDMASEAIQEALEIRAPHDEKQQRRLSTLSERVHDDFVEFFETCNE